MRREDILFGVAELLPLVPIKDPDRKDARLNKTPNLIDASILLDSPTVPEYQSQSHVRVSHKNDKISR